MFASIFHFYKEKATLTTTFHAKKITPFWAALGVQGNVRQQ